MESIWRLKIFKMIKKNDYLREQTIKNFQQDVYEISIKDHLKLKVNK